MDAARISLTIARDPALVRTVRLVAAAVARRTGQDEQFVEEVRLAVGEACALLVSDGSTGEVNVRLSLDDRLQVDVESDGVGPPQGPMPSIESLEPWALLGALADDFSAQHKDGHTTVSMSWPL